MIKVLGKTKNGELVSFLCSGKCDKDLDTMKKCEFVVLNPNLDKTKCDFLCTNEGECVYYKGEC